MDREALVCADLDGVPHLMGRLRAATELVEEFLLVGEVDVDCGGEYSIFSATRRR
jgi:hypothetical protein